MPTWPPGRPTVPNDTEAPPPARATEALVPCLCPARGHQHMGGHLQGVSVCTCTEHPAGSRAQRAHSWSTLVLPGCPLLTFTCLKHPPKAPRVCAHTAWLGVLWPSLRTWGCYWGTQSASSPRPRHSPREAWLSLSPALPVASVLCSEVPTCVL